MDENGIHGLTGCLASCNKDEFQVELGNMVVREDENCFGDFCWGETTRSMKLYAHFQNGRYEDKEQYIIYDYNSMIADVGGYMGLLLGYSLLSVYEKVEQMWLKTIATLA